MSFFQQESVKHKSGPMPALQTLSFQRQPTGDTRTILLSRVDPSGATYPVFSYIKSKKSINLNRIVPGSSISIGDAQMHDWSTTSTDLNLAGEHFKMKERDNMGGYKLDHPRFGKFKWISSKTEGGFVLEDGREMRIAKYRPGAKKTVLGGFLDVCVPADDYLLDLIVLSGLAVTAKSDELDDDDAEDAAEVLDAVANIIGGGGA